MKPNTNKLVFAVVVLLCLGSTMRDIFAQSENATAEVTATGVGITSDDAQKNAIINAVQQVVGMYVDSETLVKNEQLVLDQVLAVSSGFVSSFEVKSPPRKRLTDGLFETTIKAVVQKTRVAEQLSKTKIVSVPVDAQDAWAEAFSRLQNAQDGRRLLEKYWPEVSTQLLRARLVDDNGQPVKNASRPAVKPDPNSGLVWCDWNIEVSYDTQAYIRDVSPRLRKIFDAICIRKAQERLTRRTPTSSESQRDRRIAIIDAPIRWMLESARGSSWSSLPPATDRSEFNLTLITTTDKANFLQSAESYVMEVNPYAKILLDPIVDNVLSIKLVATDNSILLTDKLRLDHTYLHCIKPDYSDSSWQPTKSTHRIPIEGELINLQYPGLLWDTNPGHDLGNMWLIAPEFRFWYFSTGYALTDRLLLRYEIQLHPDSLKDLKEVQLSFTHQKP